MQTLPTLREAADTVRQLAVENTQLSGMLAAGISEPKALTRLGLQWLRENRTADAVKVLRYALALELTDPVLWSNYGSALNQAEKPDEASECFERSLALSNRQSHTWLLLGMMRRKLGDLAGCESAYRTALELEPDSAVFWQCLGLLKQEQKDFSAAIECFNSCLKFGEPNAALFANLGQLYYQVGRIPESAAAYAQAVKLDPASAHFKKVLRRVHFMNQILEGTAVDAAMKNWREAGDSAATEPDRELQELFDLTFGVFSGFGHADAARRVGDKYRELWPDNHSMDYLLKALNGDASPDRSPAEYVAEHFNSFAEGFDTQLVGVLGYDIPQKILTRVKEFTPPGKNYELLDAGCGTGLCGGLLREFATKMIGVDLSSKMLEQAAKKNLYDELVCEEIVNYLERNPAQFDLIVAADLVIYFGNLTPLLSALHRAMRPGGRLVFSIETWEGNGFRLGTAGRFAQSLAYVRQVAQPWFTEEQCLSTTIRLEANQPVAGSLFSFQVRADVQG